MHACIHSFILSFFFLFIQIEATPYFERVASSKEGGEYDSFMIPIFNNAKVSLIQKQTPQQQQHQKQKQQQNTNNNILHLQISNVSANDYGMICAKLYESQCSYHEEIHNNKQLRQVVKDHFSKQKPHTGYDAMLSSKTEDLVASTLLLQSRCSAAVIDDNNDDDDDDDEDDNTDKTDNEYHPPQHLQIKKLLDTLQSKGFVTIDTKLKTSRKSNDKLSTFLHKKTKQDSAIRSDTVAFLDMNDAKTCGLEDQFELLMGMASFLNEHLVLEDSGFDPLSPGTKSRPLTNPRNIQAAEYSHGEFYIAHR
jgi:hypothetical protein